MLFREINISFGKSWNSHKYFEFFYYPVKVKVLQFLSPQVWLVWCQRLAFAINWPALVLTTVYETTFNDEGACANYRENFITHLSLAWLQLLRLEINWYSQSEEISSFNNNRAQEKCSQSDSAWSENTVRQVDPNLCEDHQWQKRWHWGMDAWRWGNWVLSMNNRSKFSFSNSDSL